MSIKKIDKPEWHDYFDKFSKLFLMDSQPEYAEIRVLSTELGLQQETQWIPVRGISYDPKNDMLEVSVEELDHMILNPIEVHVDEQTDGWLTSIEIKDKQGITNIIEIR